MVAEIKKKGKNSLFWTDKMYKKVLSLIVYFNFPYKTNCLI